MKNWIENIKWTEDGLVPVVVQDHISNKVIMFAWMNRVSLEPPLNKRKQYIGHARERKFGPRGIIRLLSTYQRYDY